jgi:hypothetical protein
MPVVTIYLDDMLHRRLKRRAFGANLSISAFVRPLIEDAASPGGRYVYTSQDELLGIAIQSFMLMSEMALAQSPAIVERAMLQARAMLHERGLFDPDPPLSQSDDNRAPPSSEKRP